MLCKTLLTEFAKMDSYQRGYITKREAAQLLEFRQLLIDEKLWNIVFDLLRVHSDKIPFVALSQLVYCAQNANLSSATSILFHVLDFRQCGTLSKLDFYYYLRTRISKDCWTEVVRRVDAEMCGAEGFSYTHFVQVLSYLY